MGGCLVILKEDHSCKNCLVRYFSAKSRWALPKGSLIRSLFYKNLFYNLWQISIEGAFLPKERLSSPNLSRTDQSCPSFSS